MNFFIILLLALDLRIHCYLMVNTQDFEVIILDDLQSHKCPKGGQPVCGTNGEDIVYFENICQMEVKNYEMLTQGLFEYYECPLLFCKAECPRCDLVHAPICAIDTVTGEKKIFRNSCEKERTICLTKRDWATINIKECTADVFRESAEHINYPKHYCPELCPLEYQPICARFYSIEKEFYNECELQDTICQSQQMWHIVRRGPCRPSKGNAASKHPTVDSKCSKDCSYENKPICAKFENVLQEFPNECELDKMICQTGQNWHIVKEGHCQDIHYNRKHQQCPEFCIDVYNPVCGKFGTEIKDFRNICELLKAKCKTNINWEVLSLGPCMANPNQLIQSSLKCPQLCTQKYKPVCAEFKSSYREFTNQCELQKTICKTNEDWKLFKNGTCPIITDLNAPCSKVCTKEFNPVCASNNGQVREFFNICELNKKRCETNNTWKLVKMGSCTATTLEGLNESLSACPKQCLNEYKPVCAEFDSILKQFVNKCHMEKAKCETKTNWQLLKNGHCPLVPELKTACFRLCTKEFSPVCARYNGKLREFFNSCELEKISCETNANWIIVKRGPCFVNQFKKLVENSCLNDALDPVCAICDHKTKTFANACQLSMEIERSGNIWSILYKGPCSNSTVFKTDNLADKGNSNTAFIQETTTSVSYTTANPTTENYYKEEQTTKATNKYYYFIPKKELKEEFYDNSKEEKSSEDCSSHKNKISEDKETNSHLAEEEINETHSDEKQSWENESDSLHSFRKVKNKTFVKDNEARFNYKGYSKEDDPSEEIYFQEIEKSDSFWDNEEDNSLKKSSEKNSKECRDNEVKDFGTKNVDILSNEVSKEENDYYQVELFKKYKKSIMTNNKRKPKDVASQHFNKQNLNEAERNSLASFVVEENNLAKLMQEGIQNMFIEAKSSQNPNEKPEEEITQTSWEKSKENFQKVNPKNFEESSSEKRLQQLTNANSSQQNHQIILGLNNKNVHNDSYPAPKFNQNKHNFNQNNQNFDQNENNFVYSTQGESSLINKTYSDLDIYKLNDKNETGSNAEVSDSPVRSKKSETYNGVVYKAPVYDAPTYNFIFTAPFNISGFDFKNAIENNTFANQTFSEGNLPFNPFHFLTSLTSQNDGKFPPPKLMPASNAANKALVAHERNYSPQEKLNIIKPAHDNGSQLKGFFPLPTK